MVLTKTLIIAISLILFVKKASTANRGALKLDKMENCEDYLNTPVVYQPVQIIGNDNETIVNYNVTVKKDISKDLESLWIVEKCASKESLNNCMQFYKMKSGRYCNFLEAKGEAWSKIIDCIIPKWRCPIKKGTYEAKNCKLDLAKFNLFPLHNSYWRLKIIVTDANSKETVACLLFAGGLARLS